MFSAVGKYLVLNRPPSPPPPPPKKRLSPWPSALGSSALWAPWAVRASAPAPSLHRDSPAPLVQHLFNIRLASVQHFSTFAQLLFNILFNKLF